MAGLTAPEMWYEARLLYESIASADAPGYTSRDWSLILTQAQEKVLRDIIDEGVEKNDINKLVLSPITKTKSNLTITPDSTVVIPNSYSILENTFNPFHIESEFVYNSSLNPISLIAVKSMEFNSYGLTSKNPFEKPSNKVVFWRMVTDGKVVIVGDGSTINKYLVTYIDRPTPIVVAALTAPQAIEGITAATDCKLHHSVHRKIVEKAASLANAYIKDQVGYQISNVEENK